MVDNKKRKRTGVSFAAAEESALEESANEESVPKASTSRGLGKRAQSQKEVAESRAAHFARADPSSSSSSSNSSSGSSSSSNSGKGGNSGGGSSSNSSGNGRKNKGVSSTTPTGWGNAASANDGDAWCGPFATAHALISQREAAKKARDDAIKDSTAGKVEDVTNADEYDQYLQSITWMPHASSNAMTPTKRIQIPSLADLCVKLLAEHIEDVDDESLRFVSPDALAKFAAEMARQRKFSPEVATKLAVDGSEDLCFPECSFLVEDTLVNALSKAHGGFGVAHTQQLKSLRLTNTGHSFTDSVATIVTDKYAAALEVLNLTGCYRLTEGALCLLLAKCTRNLRVLDLSCNSRIGADAIAAICTVVNLESLKLDNIASLGDDHLSVLSSRPSGLTRLRLLSLNGLLEMTDRGLGQLLDTFGPTLTSLSVNSCVQLTDRSIMKIRGCCRQLNELDVSDLSRISTEALLGLFIDGTMEVAQEDDEDGPTKVTSGGDSQAISRALVNIKLRGLVGVTDDVIIEMTRTVGRGSLRYVDLGGCAALTSRSIAALHMHCRTSLEALDVSFVRGFTEECLGDLVDSAPFLKSLDVWGCTQMSDKFFNGIQNQVVMVVGRMDAV